MVYATVANLVSMLDTRVLAELGSDTNSDGTVDDNNTILTTAITRASADVDSVALRAEMYTAADLAALYAASDWRLIGLVTDLAIVKLYERRGGDLPPAIKTKADACRDALNDLREGKIIFGQSTSAASAGTPSVSVITRNERDNLRLVSDSDFYPGRRITAS